jgi:hypothetical protein
MSDTANNKTKPVRMILVLVFIIHSPYQKQTGWLVG